MTPTRVARVSTDSRRVSEVVRVSHGLWRPAEEVADLASRCAALLSVMPAGAVVGGLAAARLHELWLPKLDVEPIEMITRGGARLPRELAHSRRCEVRGRRRTLSDDEIGTAVGLPVTSVARTWRDLAECLGPADLVAAGDCALRRGTTFADLHEVVARSVHRRGIRLARAVIPRLDERSMSRPESHLRYLLVAAGLPCPEVNEPVYVDGEWVGVPDLHYPQARLALEYQGTDHADPRRMRGDITRELDFEWRGWKLLVLGPRQVFGRPDQVVALVRHLLQQRDPGCLS